jgi:DNA-binding transcriptional LysR family regulator
MSKSASSTATAPALDWEALRLFLCVAEQGSLSRAAEVLGVSQPTLTRQISALEASLGVMLFERTTRGMALTEVAQALTGPIQAMREQSQAVARLAQGQDAELGGVVRLSASEMTAIYLLPGMLTPLRQQAPLIDIVLIATDRVANLVEREADIAVRHVRPSQPGLVARKVAELPIGIYASDAYLARRGVPNDITDLLAHDLVGFDHADMLREGLVKSGLDASRLRFAMTSNSHEVAWRAVQAGLGIGFLPTLIGGAQAGVQRVMADAPTPVLPVWMTVHQEVKASPRLRHVYDFLAESFSRLG